MSFSEPEILKAKEAARLLRVDYKTMLKMLHDGVIPAVRAGNRWRVSKIAVLAALGLDPDGKPAERS